METYNIRYVCAPQYSQQLTMSDQSPLFVSSTELIAHSIELFTQGNERKYKFIILHLANSIELILKDRLIDEGQSIYSSPKHTIGIRDAFRELKKQDISIPERPVIELLIDDRNTIQHRFGFPDADTVYYYIDEVLGFFDRFLEDEYDVDLVEVLRNYVSEDDLSVVGLIEQYDESEPLDKLYELSPEASILREESMLLEKAHKAYLEAQTRRTALSNQLPKGHLLTRNFSTPPRDQRHIRLLKTYQRNPKLHRCNSKLYQHQENRIDAVLYFYRLLVAQ